MPNSFATPYFSNTPRCFHGVFNTYRFSFNGKEKDSETFGDGNEYDYGFRICSPRIGRFLSVDPLSKSFPWYTPYQFAGNTPISAIDLDGLEELIVTRWYDGDKFIGVTYFRIMNESDRLPGHRKGSDGLYVNLDYRLKGAIEQQLKEGTWKPTFFNIANGTPDLGSIRNTLTNQKDKDARNNLQSQNDKPGREGDNAILYGRPTETIFFEQNSSEYRSGLVVDGNNVSNDDAVKASKLFIKANPDYSVAVVGSANTDNSSGNFDNQKLSEDRANSTLSKLTQGADAVPSTKVLNNGGVGPSRAKSGATSQGTKELNRNAAINFTIPKQ